MDVLFINAIHFSSLDSPHIGQFILRDILKEKYTVECMNFDYMSKLGEITYKETLNENVSLIGEIILSKKPKIVGFYTICNAFVIAVKLAEYIKSRNSEICIIFGGPQATVTAKECLQEFGFVDLISLGEAEQQIELLVDAIVNNKGINKVPGIAFREGDCIQFNPSLNLISENELGKYTVYDYSPFKIDSGKRLGLEGGRGCPFSCTFCTTSSFWGRKYRVKDVELLVNEMKIFNQKYNVSKFSIQHDMFTAKRKHVMDFCNTLINEELGFDWTCSSRIDVLDKDLLDTMKQANCTSIYLGIETGSKRMQKILAKNLNLDEAFEMIKYLKEIRMRMTISFIYCFPDETVDDFKETIKLVEKILKLGITDVQMHRFMPLPSTTETSKVEDVMYFDEKYIELSMNNVKFHDKDIKDMLIKYPRMFSQYYTFDSEVKDKYKRFDNLIELISAMSEFYINTIINLINKYGLEKLYFFMEDILDKIYSITQEDEVSLRVNPDLTYKIARINQELEPFIMHEVEKDNHLFVKEIFRYENNKLHYFVQKKSDPLVLKFKINIEEMIFNQKIIVEDYYIKYSVKGREVITTHLIPVPKKNFENYV